MRKGEGVFINYKENFYISVVYIVFIFILYYFYLILIVNNLLNFIFVIIKF